MRSAYRLVLTCCAISGAVIVGGALLRGQSSVVAVDAKRLIGTWKLVSFESTDQEMRQLRGANPIGLIFYDATGHMAAQITPDRVRRRFTGPVSGVFAGPRPTADEALDALNGYTAYFGTYSVDERARTVTHHRLGNLNPGALGDFVRRYEFVTNDRLVLVPLDSPDLRSARITVERLK
jgi:hypothetical protein